MKRILGSVAVLAFVGALILGGTGAFFSDTETSTGNTFTAGAIDLKVSNQSYYNGVAQSGTSWSSTDLDNGQLFFNFLDLKPGDLGEDTIDLVVQTNDGYACMDINVTGTPEGTITEPESDVPDTTVGTNEGELQNELHFTFWADDGDNVLEQSEVDDIFIDNKMLSEIAPGDAKVVLADSTDNVWTGTAGPMTGATTYYIGKVFCYGTLTQSPVADGAGNPTVASGFMCDGGSVTNISQTDGVVGDVSFTAVQTRNNASFLCNPPQTGNIIVVKQTEPDGDDTEFSFSTSYGSPFSLSDGGSNDSGPLSAGTYSVSEGDLVGWNLASATCSDGSPVSAVVLSAGETVTCTFTNSENQPEVLFSDNFQLYGDGDTLNSTNTGGTWTEVGGAMADDVGGAHDLVAQLNGLGDDDERILSTIINATGRHSISISYDRFTAGLDSPFDTFTSDFTVNGGSSYTTLESISTNGGWTTMTWSLSPTANNEPDLQVRFSLIDPEGSGESALIDNVVVTGIAD